MLSLPLLECWLYSVEKGTPISRSQVKVKSHRALQFSTAGFALQLNLIG
jgi:hypothetical protein